MMKFFFSFYGRARRSHWWLGRLGAYVLAVLVIVAEFASFHFIFPDTRSGEGGYGNTHPLASNIGGASVLILLVLVTWAELALTVRRWHDRDKSGLMVFILLIPLVGPIWTIVECGFLDGTHGSNSYGPSPKGINGPEV